MRDRGREAEEERKTMLHLEVKHPSGPRTWFSITAPRNRVSRRVNVASPSAPESGTFGVPVQSAGTCRRSCGEGMWLPPAQEMGVEGLGC